MISSEHNRLARQFRDREECWMLQTLQYEIHQYAVQQA